MPWEAVTEAVPGPRVRNRHLDAEWPVSAVSVQTETTFLMETLSPVARKFILHWGEMGTRWGVNRTVAQIHALLFLAEKPLHAEEICDRLTLARSNVSTSLRELQNWGIVKIVHVMGDRRDHFESIHDVWELFRVIAAERKRREMDPTLRVLRECVAEAGKKGNADAVTTARLQEMADFFELAASGYSHLSQLPPKSMMRLAKMGDKIASLVAGPR
jgi:DNA-binding transcriptional regulator GbsR (MarR family)